MKRRLRTLLALLSLPLCVAVVGLWVRSYRRVITFDAPRRGDDAAARFRDAGVGEVPDRETAEPLRRAAGMMARSLRPP